MLIDAATKAGKVDFTYEERSFTTKGAEDKEIR
jgi:hypothetical protein